MDQAALLLHVSAVITNGNGEIRATVQSPIGMKEELMNTALQRLFTWTLLVCLPLFIAACGGGDGGEANAPVTMTTISGTATKGPIKNALVQVFQLRADGRTGDLLGSGISGADGAYAIEIPAVMANGPVLVRVSGQEGATYTSESTRQEVQFKAGEAFNAIVEAVAPGQKLTVSPLTEAAYQQFQKILTDNPTLANNAKVGGAINAANDRIATLYFGLGSTGSMILADPAENKPYAAALHILDQVIETQKTQGVQANTTTTMNAVNQALSNADVTDPLYQAYLRTLTAAAEKVKQANPNDQELRAAVDAIVVNANNPPDVPVWTDTVQPTAPSSLAATTTLNTDNTGSIFLSWSPSTDNVAVAGYDIYRDDNKIATVTATVRSYADVSLAVNATYTYVVFAFDAVGNRSVASNQVLVPLGVPVTDTTPPSQPKNLSASTFLTETTASVVLMWSPSTDNKAVTGYDVYRDDIKIATTNTPGYEDPLVQLSTNYKYHVVAFDGAGNRSISSTQLSVTPNRPSLGVTVNGQVDPGNLPATDIIAPSAPTGLSAATFAQTGTTSSVVLSWKASTDNVEVTGYEIYRNGSKIATVSQPGYTDPSVLSNITYTYFVKAFDAAGNRSNASNQLLVRPNQTSLGVTVNGQVDPGNLPQTDIVAPSAPTNLTASTTAVSATSSSVLLAWSPSSDNTAVTGYEIYRNGIKIATVSYPGYLDPSVTSSDTYTYYIIAFDAAGNRSATSNQLSVTPNRASLGVTVNGQVDPGNLPQNDISAPTAPRNLTASTAAVTATTSSVFLTWSPSFDATGVSGYDVYRNGSKIASVSLLGYTDLSATSNETFVYYVVAFDAAGNRSQASSELSVTPNRASLGVTVSGQVDPGNLPHNDISAPTAPTGLKASTAAVSSTTSSVLLTWSTSTDNTAVVGYEVYRNGSKVGTVALLGFTDYSVTSNATYIYYVVAFDAAGNRSAASNQLSVTPSRATLGITVNGQISTGNI
jgi:chitin-binding protein